MRLKKKILGIILSLVLMLGLMPWTSLTAYAVETDLTMDDLVRAVGSASFTSVYGLDKLIITARTGELKLTCLDADMNQQIYNAVDFEYASYYGRYCIEFSGLTPYYLVLDNDNYITAFVETGNEDNKITGRSEKPFEKSVTNYTVTYKVVNGTWDGTSTADKTETVANGGNPASVPTGMKANSGYTGGSWDTDPSNAAISADTTFTYTFVADSSSGGDSSDSGNSGSSDSGSTSGGSTDSGSSSGSSSSSNTSSDTSSSSSSSSNSSTSTSTTAPATVPYENVAISTGAVNDITGTAAATAESNPFGTKIENNDNLTTLLALTPEEVAQGVNVWLDIQDMSATVPQADKDLVQSASNNFTVGMYLDINLFKKVGGNAATKITETNGTVKASILIPESLWKAGRTFEIIRVHDGVPTVISGTYDENTHVFTFETDKFSTYALAYNDSANSTQSTAPRTGDNNHLGIRYLLLAVSLGGLGYLGYTKKKRVNK